MILEMEYAGLRKVISGGQCGADRGGLEAARAMGLDTGGTAPKGYRTWYGPAPDLADFGVVEHTSPLYPPRTAQNIRDSDATLIVASNPDSGGTLLTQRLCRSVGKPYHIITLPIADRSKVIESACNFIQRKCVEVLNVAGNRDTGTGPKATFHHDETVSIVTDILKELDRRQLLNRVKDK